MIVLAVEIVMILSILAVLLSEGMIWVSFGLENAMSASGFAG